MSIEASEIMLYLHFQLVLELESDLLLINQARLANVFLFQFISV